MPHATSDYRLPSTVCSLSAAAKVCAKELNEVYFNELGLGAEDAATAKTNAKRRAVHATWRTTVASRQLPVGCTKTVSASVSASCCSCCYAQKGNTLLTQSVCEVGNKKKKEYIQTRYKYMQHTRLYKGGRQAEIHVCYPKKLQQFRKVICNNNAATSQQKPSYLFSKKLS